MIEEIVRLFDRFGDLGYGEHVSQRAHALQCARLAVEDGASDSLIAAALLHDIGQFLDDAGHAAEREGLDARHETSGAAFLARCFPPAVSEPVRLHVSAKRYLCATRPGYAEALSGASRLSLELQGGPFDAAGVRAFEDEAWFADAVRLRLYDDAGKRRDWQVPPLDHYLPLLREQMAEDQGLS